GGAGGRGGGGGGAGGAPPPRPGGRGGRGGRPPPRRLDLGRRERGDHALGGGERRMPAGGAARVRERAIEPRVREASEAIADLLARAGELVGAEPAGRLGEGPVYGLAQPALVVAARAGGEDRHRPVEAVLDARRDVVAEPEALADLLEEAGIGIRADDLDRHRKGQDVARRRRRGDETHEVRLREVAAVEPDHPGCRVSRRRRGRADGRRAGGEGASDRPAEATAIDAADDGEGHAGG